MTMLISTMHKTMDMNWLPRKSKSQARETTMWETTEPDTRSTLANFARRSSTRLKPWEDISVRLTPTWARTSLTKYREEWKELLRENFSKKPKNCTMISLAKELSSTGTSSTSSRSNYFKRKSSLPKYHRKIPKIYPALL